MGSGDLKRWSRNRKRSALESPLVLMSPTRICSAGDHVRRTAWCGSGSIDLSYYNATMMKLLRGRGVSSVYVVSHAERRGPVKVGWTSNVRYRFSQLQTFSPNELFLEGLCWTRSILEAQ